MTGSTQRKGRSAHFGRRTSLLVATDARAIAPCGQRFPTVLEALLHMSQAKEIRASLGSGCHKCQEGFSDEVR